MSMRDPGDVDLHAPTPHDESDGGAGGTSYWRFAGMIATGMAVMFAVMYANTYQLSHVQWSETRFFMTLLMGATMAIVMLAWMLNMYQDRTINTAIFVGAIVVFALGTWLVRSQTTVQDESYMSAMIPHHSIAILTSENSELSDIRVCELAVGIIQAQRREIDEMEWLIADIEENGPATTPAEAEARPLPDFEGTATRDCVDE